MSKFIVSFLLLTLAAPALAKDCMAYVKHEEDVYLIKDFAECDLNSRLGIQRYLDQHLDLARADVRTSLETELPRGYDRSILEGLQLARLANIREAISRINALLNK